MFFVGLDIGGSKCSVTLGMVACDSIEVFSKQKFDTLVDDPDQMLKILSDSLYSQIRENGLSFDALVGIGICCGSPINSTKGVILAPPNLPNWKNVYIVDYFKERFHVKTVLQNDANACALAEWRFGAGIGSENMVFLTFGTGFGAGLILNSKLYCGSDDMAGEIGHIRIAESGSFGYGKVGSIEGFCSGGGIARIGQEMIHKEIEKGKTCPLLDTCGDISNITAKAIADLADAGDNMCIEIYKISGRKLGIALSILVDLLNPDTIVIGSIFARSYNLLWETCNQVMKEECLPVNYNRCKVVKSGLGESLGDVAALAIAAIGYV